MKKIIRKSRGIWLGLKRNGFEVQFLSLSWSLNEAHHNPTSSCRKEFWSVRIVIRWSSRAKVLTPRKTSFIGPGFGLIRVVLEQGVLLLVGGNWEEERPATLLSSLLFLLYNPFSSPVHPSLFVNGFTAFPLWQSPQESLFSFFFFLKNFVLGLCVLISVESPTLS